MSFFGKISGKKTAPASTGVDALAQNKPNTSLFRLTKEVGKLLVVSYKAKLAENKEIGASRALGKAERPLNAIRNLDGDDALPENAPIITRLNSAKEQARIHFSDSHTTVTNLTERYGIIAENISIIRQNRVDAKHEKARSKLLGEISVQRAKIQASDAKIQILTNLKAKEPDGVKKAKIDVKIARENKSQSEYINEHDKLQNEYDASYPHQNSGFVQTDSPAGPPPSPPRTPSPVVRGARERVGTNAQPALQLRPPPQPLMSGAAQLPPIPRRPLPAAPSRRPVYVASNTTYQQGYTANVEGGEE